MTTHKPAVLGGRCVHWWVIDDSNKGHGPTGNQMYWEECKKCHERREIPCHAEEDFTLETKLATSPLDMAGRSFLTVE